MYAIFGEPLSIVLSSPGRGREYNSQAILHDLANQQRIRYNYIDMGAYEYTLPDVPDWWINRLVEIPAVEGVRTQPAAGLHYVESQRNFTLTVIPLEGYTLKNLKVSSGSQQIDEERTSVVWQSDGSVTVTFHKVTESLHVTLENVLRETVGSEAVN
jgi:hypothetical protein